MYVCKLVHVCARHVLFESLAVRDQQPCLHWKDSSKSNCMWDMSSQVQSCTTDSRVLHALLLCSAVVCVGGGRGEGGVVHTYLVRKTNRAAICPWIFLDMRCVGYMIVQLIALVNTHAILQVHAHVLWLVLLSRVCIAMYRERACRLLFN